MFVVSIINVAPALHASHAIKENKGRSLSFDKQLFLTYERCVVRISYFWPTWSRWLMSGMSRAPHYQQALFRSSMLPLWLGHWMALIWATELTLALHVYPLTLLYLSLSELEALSLNSYRVRLAYCYNGDLMKSTF